MARKNEVGKGYDILDCSCEGNGNRMDRDGVGVVIPWDDAGLEWQGAGIGGGNGKEEELGKGSLSWSLMVFGEFEEAVGTG